MTPRRGFHVSISLCLPRDEVSVPVVRHLVNHALEEVGVLEEQAHDVELAMSEACANVLTHAGPGDAYDVSIEIGPELCEIRVIDLGHGYDFHSLSREMSELDAESGRGIALMDALMDRVRFISAPERGTVVHLVKQLQFDDSRPTRRLMLAAMARSGAEPDAPS